MKKPKALVLFSGGLDSLLTVKLLQSQGIQVECIKFLTPFFKDTDFETLEAKIHKVKVGKKYFDIIKNPKHGHGSGMNPCIDCKIYMLKKAKAFAKKLHADFIATGEVLGQRPFSQTKNLLLHIEKESGLTGKVLRPLSAKLLKPTEPEIKGIVNREKLLDIRGRSRKKQIELAKKFGIKKFPSPGSGCLLTDTEFSKRLRDLIDHQEPLNWNTAELLKLGRHFRFLGAKIVTGRNKEENEKLLKLGKKLHSLTIMVKDYPGPVTLVFSSKKRVIKKACELTVSYSDAPKNKEIDVIVLKGRKKFQTKCKAIKLSERKRLMI